jgi:hypothetical protein
VYRWEHGHGHVGVNAPSWLTFELYRPYFDGAASELTPIQSRGPVVAARRFATRDPFGGQHAMVMPASFRQLLVEESRLRRYGATRPTDLADELASPDWQMMADAYRRRDQLDPVDRAGLVAWLVAVCLPDAVLDVLPADHPAPACADPLVALAQYGRAMALFQRDGLSPHTTDAFAVLATDPVPTLGHAQATGVYAYLLARNATDPGQAPGYAYRARELFDELRPSMSTFNSALWTARVPLREVTLAERAGDLERAWRSVEQARAASGAVQPTSPEDGSVAVELHRRILDRRVEIAVKRGDGAAETGTVEEGVALDPTCVKIRMQLAQCLERRGDLAGALAGYLHASWLGPFGTAFALLHAASCAGRLGQHELARVLCERAYRSAPRSAQTRTALVRACRATGDEPLAAELDRPETGYRTAWHVRMYAAHLNLGHPGLPGLTARRPWLAYQLAVQGELPVALLTMDPPVPAAPALRDSLVQESGLAEFAVRYPAQLPQPLRTPAWQQLCAWVAGFGEADPERQLLTALVLREVGLGQLLLDLVGEPDLAQLRDPAAFHLAAVRARSAAPLVDAPHCPPELRLAGALAGLTRTRRDRGPEQWSDRAGHALTEVLAADRLTAFDQVVLHSRYHRGMARLALLRRDPDAVAQALSAAEALARSALAQVPWQEQVQRADLVACLTGRAVEARWLGDPGLAQQRLEAALAVDPYDPVSQLRVGCGLTRLGRFDAAAVAFLRAARLGPPATALAYRLAADCQRRTGEPAVAEDGYLQALRIDPLAGPAVHGWLRTASADLAPVARGYAEDLARAHRANVGRDPTPMGTGGIRRLAGATRTAP